jgi:hypothetical protein
MTEDEMDFFETLSGKCSEIKSRGTLHDAWLHYFKEKPLRQGRANPDSQDRSCMARTFRKVAANLGVGDWKPICIEVITVPLLERVYDDLMADKRCSEASARRAVDEDFRVCARAFYKYGIQDEDNPFLLVRMARNLKAKPPKPSVTYPRKAVDGKVCKKVVPKTRKENADGGLGLIHQPAPVILRGSEPHVKTTILDIKGGRRVTRVTMNPSGSRQDG